MNAVNQIARNLKIEASRIIRCEEWAKVWFVVIQGKGARFVSKKVVKVAAMGYYNMAGKIPAKLIKPVKSGVKFDRGSRDSVLIAAARLSSYDNNTPRYVYPNYFGMQITEEVPAFNQSHMRVTGDTVEQYIPA